MPSDSTDLTDAPPPLTAYALDAPGTHERDDAIHIEQDATTGDYRVTVYVPDLTRVTWSAFVEANALLAGFTEYRGDAPPKPMLPRFVAEKHGLNTGTRNCLAVSMQFHANGDRALGTNIILAKRSFATVERATGVKVVAVTYADAVDAPTNPYRDTFAVYRRFAESRVAARRKTGTRTAEYNLTHGYAVGEDGGTIRLSAAQRNVGYIIVQECMIAANESIAFWAHEQGVPFLYRTHEYATEADGEPRYATLGRAEYTPAPGRHVGLNLPLYAHCTSPLRRYADLVNQRQIATHLMGKSPCHNRRDLERLALWLNGRGREEADSESAGHKSVAEKKAAARIGNGETTAQSLAALGDREFYRVLRVAATQDGNPVAPAVLEAFALRTAQGKTTPHEAMVLFFDAPDCRRQVLPFLNAAPQNAAQLLEIALAGNRIAGSVTYFESATGGDRGLPPVFTAEAMHPAFPCSVGRSGEQSTKKAARFAAALDLLKGVASNAVFQGVT